MNNIVLACFLSLVHTRSYAATAEDLSITQQALSRNIQKLEDELGCSLLRKNTQSVVLTAAGREYYEYFYELGQELSAATRLIKGDGRKKELGVGWCEWTGCPEWIHRAVRSFARLYPDVKINVRQASFKMLRSLLFETEIDVALTSRFMAKTIKGPYLSTAIGEMPLYAVISSRHPMVQTGLEKILSLPHITSYGYEDKEEQVQANVHCEYEKIGAAPEAVTVLPNWNSVYVDVNMGNGITFSPANNTVSMHDCFTLLPMKRGVTLSAIRRIENINPNVKLFMSHLKSCSEEENE